MSTIINELRELQQQQYDIWWRLQVAIECYKKEQELGYTIPMCTDIVKVYKDFLIDLKQYD